MGLANASVPKLTTALDLICKAAASTPLKGTSGGVIYEARMLCTAAITAPCHVTCRNLSCTLLRASLGGSYERSSLLPPGSDTKVAGLRRVCAAQNATLPAWRAGDLRERSGPARQAGGGAQLPPRARTAARCVASSAGPVEEMEFAVDVGLEERLEGDVGHTALAEQLALDARLAVKVATEGFEALEDKATVELSVLLCDDGHIQELNREWRNEDMPTDVLSFPQDQPPGLSPTLLLGDIIISLDTAARQAGERGHSLLDELRILTVHGLLHLIGYDHEEGPEGERAMGEEEGRILAALGWAGQGLISGSSSQSPPAGSVGTAERAADEGGTAATAAAAAEKPKRSKQAPFKYLFCDMDGTLLNSKSRVTASTAAALQAAKARGVTIVIATGKARPAALSALEPVGLLGQDGVVTLQSPGVFLQGLRVYGKEGRVVHSALLREDVCIEGYRFAEEHQVALIGFSGDRCVTLFDHPKVQALHAIYYEPKAEVLPSIGDLLLQAPISKLLFYDTPEGVRDFIRPHWAAAVGGRATLTQAVPDMLEILPHGASKGAGVQILLDHLGVRPDEVMAIGDGENDIEMLQLAGLGVAMANGAARTLAAANATVASNDDDGVAEAVERFILGQ